MQSILYNIIEKRKLDELLETFYNCTDLPVQVLDENGSILSTFGSSYNYCRIFKKYLPHDDSCTRLHSNASKLAMNLGETYIFSCHSNLNHIVYPLTNNNVLLGSILAGPFLMSSPDSSLLSELGKRYDIPTAQLLEMYEEASSIPVLAPSKVTSISRMLYYMCAGLVTDSRSQFTLSSNKLHQQSLINESVQMYKASEHLTQHTYPYDKEKLLITRLKTGDADGAKELLNDLLGYVFYTEGSNLLAVKTRALELSSLISRAIIETGAPAENVLKINNDFLLGIQNLNHFEDLCYRLQETLDLYAGCIFHFSGNAALGNDSVKKAIQYISVNYFQNITLDMVAAYAHLNPAYFSTLFKNTTGHSFKEYLTMVRIEESKRLLKTTSHSIVDICLAVGFEDQSYFSKVFKKYTGLTPKQYR